MPSSAALLLRPAPGGQHGGRGAWARSPSPPDVPQKRHNRRDSPLRGAGGSWHSSPWANWWTRRRASAGRREYKKISYPRSPETAPPLLLPSQFYSPPSTALKYLFLLLILTASITKRAFSPVRPLYISTSVLRAASSAAQGFTSCTLLPDLRRSTHQRILAIIT